MALSQLKYYYRRHGNIYLEKKQARLTRWEAACAGLDFKFMRFLLKHAETGFVKTFPTPCPLSKEGNIAIIRKD